MIEEIVKSSMPINIELTYCEDGVIVGQIKHHKTIDGCIASGKTKEEVSLKLNSMMSIMLSHYFNESNNYTKRAIFRGNWSKNQIWFTIVGIGFTLYIRPKEYITKIPKIEKCLNIILFNKVRLTICNYWKALK